MALVTVEDLVEKLSPKHRRLVERLATDCFESGGFSEKEALQEGYQIFYEQQCELRSPEYQDYLEEIREE